MVDFVALIMFATVFVALLAGYAVAPTLAGVALLFAFGGALAGVFDLGDLGFLPGRLFGIVTNQTLIAVPLFVCMGVTLERTRIAEALLDSLGKLFGRVPGGLALAVTLVGALMAASTGIVGATVVTLGLLSLPTMLRRGYEAKVAAGAICATGTLGQIIPPSIALVLLGDVLSSAYQEAQLGLGVFSPKTVSIGHLFAGALLPGLTLVGLYLAYLLLRMSLSPVPAPTPTASAASPPGVYPAAAQKEAGMGQRDGPGKRPATLLGTLAPPIVLVVAVLGSILGGYATPTEAAGVGALGALALAAAQRAVSVPVLREIGAATVKTTAMVFFILIGASIFSLVFRGYGGDELVAGLFATMPGGAWGATLIVMATIFLLGFVLDFIEITYVVVPIVGPVLLAMGVDPVWLGVMIAVNLQTSFLTPPFGFALFYLRGVAPPEVATADIYRGVAPFIVLQLGVLGLLVALPQLATWLPAALH